MQNNYGQDKLEFRQIVLKHIQTILQISNQELRNKTISKTNGNFSETIENEDTRRSYIQSIENLAYILLPWFDKPMQEIYDECIDVLLSYKFEMEEKFPEDYKIFSKEFTNEDDGLESFIVEAKLNYAKKLFVAINQLLHRNDYLKSAVFGEDKNEVVEENE